VQKLQIDVARINSSPNRYAFHTFEKSHVFCVALRSMHSGLLFVPAVVGVSVAVLRWLLPRFQLPLLPLLSAVVSLLLSQRSLRNSRCSSARRRIISRKFSVLYLSSLLRIAWGFLLNCSSGPCRVGILPS